MALLTYLLRGWGKVIAIIGAVVASGWACYLWSLDLDTQLHHVVGARLQIDTGASIDLLGFILRLEPAAVPIISVTLGLVAIAFLFSIPMGQGRSFVPFTLALSSGYIALALLTVGPLSPALVAPLLLAILTVIGVFMLQAGNSSSPAGPIRSMLPPLLAFPLFLLASWYIDQIPLNPQDISPAYTAAQLIALGLIIILAPMPLHGALPAISKNSPPLWQRY